MVEMKRCIGCDLEKEINDFYNKKNQCKVCIIEYQREYKKENKDEIKEKSKIYYQENKDEIKQYYQENKGDKKIYYQENKEVILENKKQYYQENKDEMLEYHKEYYQKNKDDIKQYFKEYQKNRYQNDPEYRLHKNISGSVRNVLKCKKGGQSVLKYLPYTMEELKKHIEYQFEPWMTWDNWGVYNKDTHEINRTWHLDHKIAHSKFKYKDMKCKEFQECWALSNLQPLDSKENIFKSDK